MTNLIAAQMVEQFRELATQSSGFGTQDQHNAPDYGFAEVLHAAINEVNRSQQDVHSLEANLAQGKGDRLQDVLDSLQKASISFHSMTKAHGNLISAYQAFVEEPVG